MIEESSLKLDRWLFVVVTAIITIVAIMMSITYIAQYFQNHEALKEVTGKDEDAAIARWAISYLSQDSLLRTSTFFLSFVLIYIGCLYVLRTGSIAYQLSGSAGSFKGALQTSSPGLVLATLGVIVLLVTILTADRKNPMKPYASVSYDENLSYPPKGQTSPYNSTPSYYAPNPQTYPPLWPSTSQPADQSKSETIYGPPASNYSYGQTYTPPVLTAPSPHKQ